MYFCKFLLLCLDMFYASGDLKMENVEFLKVPNQFSSQKTAEDMALLAYNRALKLSKPGLFSFFHVNSSSFYFMKLITNVASFCAC